jgi:hypothetical protein
MIAVWQIGNEERLNWIQGMVKDETNDVER